MLTFFVKRYLLRPMLGMPHILRMTLGERIKEARKRAKLSQAALGARLGGLSREAISQWESNSTRPSTANLLNLHEIIQLDLAWLAHPPIDPGIIRVPVVSWVSAGHFVDSPAVEAWEDLPAINTIGLDPNGAWIALEVEGTSMNLVAPPGSMIFVNRKERTLHSNGDYVIATDDGATFKRFRSDPPRFMPVSNDNTHEILFPRGQVKVIGRCHRVLLDY